MLLVQFKQLTALSVLLTSLAGINAAVLSNGSIYMQSGSRDGLQKRNDIIHFSEETQSKIQKMMESALNKDLEQENSGAASRYLNFNEQDATDKHHLQRLRQGEKDAITFASSMVNQWDDALEFGIYQPYFSLADKTKVRKVYHSALPLLLPRRIDEAIFLKDFN